MTKIVSPLDSKPKTADDELQARRQDVLDTFTSEAGKRVLDRLIAGNGMNSPTFCPGDPYASAFAEGKRAVVLEILGTMGRGMTPQDFIQREH